MHRTALLPQVWSSPCLMAAVCILGMLISGSVHAAIKLRAQATQRGDMLMFGNTLGHDCRAGVLKPTVGAVGDCGSMDTIDDSSPDVWWRAEDDGTASASSTVAYDAARSSAVLKLPPGAEVTYARLYWGSFLPEGGLGSESNAITVDRPGVGGFTETIAPARTDALLGVLGGGYAYSTSADVTLLLQQHGGGVYRVSKIAKAPAVNRTQDIFYGGWAIVVFYKRSAEPVRNLVLYDGLELAGGMTALNIPLGGLLVPQRGAPLGKLGILAYDGDFDKTSSLLLNGKLLADPLNPSDRFFNSSRSNLGMPVSNVGDLPQLLGLPGSMSGVDLDVVDITSSILSGDTSATLSIPAGSDIVVLTTLVTSLTSSLPELQTTLAYSPPCVGGLRSDTIELTSTTINIGNDTGTDITIEQPIPAGLTYVAGSVRFLDDSGRETAQSDAPGDDQVDYDPARRALQLRIGQGADAAKGGSLSPSDVPVRFKFRAWIDDPATAEFSVQNTATATPSSRREDGTLTFASGTDAAQGAPLTFTVTESERASCSFAARGGCRPASLTAPGAGITLSPSLLAVVLFLLAPVLLRRRSERSACGS